MSLDVDGENETPVQAFARKMPPRGEIVVDEQTEEEYHVECGRTTFHIPQLRYSRSMFQNVS